MGFVKKTFLDSYGGLRAGWAVLLFFTAIFSLFICGFAIRWLTEGRVHKNNVYCIQDKDIKLGNGQTYYLLSIARNSRKFFADHAHLSKSMVIGVSPETYDFLKEDEYYYQKDLRKAGIDLKGEFYLIDDKRRVLEDNQETWVLVVLKKKPGEGDFDNPRIRAKVSKESYDAVSAGRYYSLEMLEHFGITLPAEKEER